MSTVLAHLQSDAVCQLRFGRVLRALLAEQVSIAPWREILRVIQDVGLPHDDVHKAVQAVRLRLKPYLPGNGPQILRKQVPESVETRVARWLQAQDGKLYFSIPPEDTQDLLSTIRTYVEPFEKDIALVVRELRVRPFIRKLIELEFPNIMVMAEEECLTPDEQVAPALQHEGESQ